MVPPSRSFSFLALSLGVFFLFSGLAEASPLLSAVGQAASGQAAAPRNSVGGRLTAPDQQPGTGLPTEAEGRQAITAQEAVALLTNSAEQGQPEAMMSLASFYEQGLGVARNHSEALEWYQKAAEKNLPAGFYQLGLAYEAGKGVTANRDAAVTYFQKAADLKVAEAAYKLAALAMAGPAAKSDDQKALDYLRKAGVSGPRGQETLGTFYENGVGVIPNYSTAFNWYQKAAAGGLATAYFRLGTCYEIGFGTAADPQAALANFQKAADLKLAAAAYKLAALYLGGALTPPDQKKAFQYLQGAANNGHALAANELGVVYLQGLLEQPVDTDKALDSFLKGADLGNTEAMKNIAVVFKNGLGRKPDAAQALKWYTIARKAGYQAEGLEELINEIKKPLTPARIKESEAEADKWLAAFEAERPAPAQN
ncbi:MAG: sel1 repeat family protein [Candidatus Adiutrix sp.]|jgi:TPR repeat protein|nr:sel1 repeat family protein [Candidatus Adiutrix sp.]